MNWFISTINTNTLATRQSSFETNDENTDFFHYKENKTVSKKQFPIQKKNNKIQGSV